MPPVPTPMTTSQLCVPSLVPACTVAGRRPGNKLGYSYILAESLFPRTWLDCMHTWS